VFLYVFEIAICHLRRQSLVKKESTKDMWVGCGCFVRLRLKQVLTFQQPFQR
jgi:hypothetical protein